LRNRIACSRRCNVSANARCSAPLSTLVAPARSSARKSTIVTGGNSGLSPRVVAIVGTGVCGGYTTFSTFSYDNIRLMEDGSALAALGNAAASIACGLAAAALGLGLALVL